MSARDAQYLANGRTLRREHGKPHEMHWSRRKIAVAEGYLIGVVTGLLLMLVAVDAWLTPLLRVGGGR